MNLLQTIVILQDLYYTTTLIAGSGFVDNMNRHPIISYQPLRLLFRIAYVGSIVGHLPFWFLFSLVPFLRPRRRWTAKNAFTVWLSRALIDMGSRIGITETLSLEKGKEGDRFQVAEPANSDLYQGPLVSDIKPAAVGGTWFPAPLGPDVGSKMTVLYFHGGAYVQGDGRKDYCGFAGNLLAENSGTDVVFSVQYRLSGYSGLNPFPAALQDALTTYLFLLRQLQIPPHHIVLCGDSAGGNLAIALLRYIRDFGEDLKIPTPRCAALFSPWVAPFDFDRESNVNRRSDYLPESFLTWGARAYAGGLPEPTSHPYITPLGHPFATPVPIFVSAGSAELFYDSNLRWAEMMNGVGGNVVEFHSEEGSCHDTLLVGDKLGFEMSAQDSVLKLRSFINRS